MEAPFTFMDRAITLEFYPEKPISLKLYLGDDMDRRLERCLQHYQQPHTLEEDVTLLEELVGRNAAGELLGRAEIVDRITVIELIGYIMEGYLAEVSKKIAALTLG